MKITRSQIRRIIRENVGSEQLPFGFYRNDVNLSGRGSQGDLEVYAADFAKEMEKYGLELVDIQADENASTGQVFSLTFQLRGDTTRDLDRVTSQLNRVSAPASWTAEVKEIKDYDWESRRYVMKDVIELSASLAGFDEPVYSYGR